MKLKSLLALSLSAVMFYAPVTVFASANGPVDFKECDTNEVPDPDDNPDDRNNDDGNHHDHNHNHGSGSSGSSSGGKSETFKENPGNDLPGDTGDDWPFSEWSLKFLLTGSTKRNVK